MSEQEIKKIDIKEFVEKGYLQEANRRFFHPLGLALAVNKKESGEYVLDSVWDSRDDPEGFAFGSLDQENIEKGHRVMDEWEKKSETRQQVFGFTVQPLISGEIKRIAGAE